MITLTLYYSPTLPYESLLSRASINKKIKEKKIEKKINIDLAILPSHDTTGREVGEESLSVFSVRGLLYNCLDHMVGFA